MKAFGAATGTGVCATAICGIGVCMRADFFDSAIFTVLGRKENPRGNSATDATDFLVNKLCGNFGSGVVFE